jgi:hypothetical protein
LIAFRFFIEDQRAVVVDYPLRNRPLARDIAFGDDLIGQADGREHLQAILVFVEQEDRTLPGPHLSQAEAQNGIEYGWEIQAGADRLTDLQHSEALKGSVSVAVSGRVSRGSWECARAMGLL